MDIYHGRIFTLHNFNLHYITRAQVKIYKILSNKITIN